MSSVLAQSLQLVLQETTAIGALAVFSVGVGGMSLRRLVHSVVAEEDDRSEAQQPRQRTRSTPRPITDGSGHPRHDGSDRPTAPDGAGADHPASDRGTDEAAFENRLDTLEEEVDDLSSTVEAVQSENEQIAEDVEEVNGNLQRLLDLSGSLARGVNPFSSGGSSSDQSSDESEDAFQRSAADESEDTLQRNAPDEPEDAFQRNANRNDQPESVDSSAGVKRHRPVQHDKVETIPEGTGAAEDFDPLEEEVEELDTLSFSDDGGDGFSEHEDEELGKEEVIDGPEPAPMGDAIGDGGTLIETREEELDIEPGSVSEPSPSPESTESESTEPASTEPTPEVESGFEFGVKPTGDDSEEASDDEQISSETTEATEHFEDASAEDDQSAAASLESESDSTPLDDQTEAELAAAEAAFAAELDASDAQSPLAEELDATASEEAGLFDIVAESEAAAETPSETTPSPSSETTASSDSEESSSADAAATEPRAAHDSDASVPDLSAAAPKSERPAATETEPSQSHAPEARDELDSTSAAVSRLDAGLSARAVSVSGGKPYIRTLPNGYSTELLVVEWLESLVENIGIHGAARAIEYYESLDWITTDVADQLDAYLYGFQNSGADTLDADHHLQSLAYVDELAQSAAETGGDEQETEK